jgi:hypothetical protein
MVGGDRELHYASDGRPLDRYRCAEGHGPYFPPQPDLWRCVPSSALER